MRIRRGLVGLGVAIAFLTTAAVSDTAHVTSGQQVAATVASRASSTDDAVDRVVAISVDGLNPKAIRDLGPTRAPTFHRLMSQGAWTYMARSTWESTATLPNHTSMLTGRRVDRRAGGHGLVVNVDDGAVTVHQAAGGYTASIFDVVHDRGGRTALYASKTKFALYPRTWNMYGAPDLVAPDHGRAKIDTFVVDSDARLVARLNTQLATAPPQFTFVHLALPDLTGHAKGYLSKEYLTAVSQTDRLLGTIVGTVSARPSLSAHTLILLTSDHGGSGRSHADPRQLANYKIPFMAWGPGVPAGADLYALNRTAYRSPGTARPGYSGRQPIRNGDLANVAADALDLPAVPGSTINSGRRLTVFR